MYPDESIPASSRIDFNADSGTLSSILFEELPLTDDFLALVLAVPVRPVVFVDVELVLLARCVVRVFVAVVRVVVLRLLVPAAFAGRDFRSFKNCLLFALMMSSRLELMRLSLSATFTTAGFDGSKEKPSDAIFE